MLEKIIKNPKLRIAVGIAAFYFLTNIPAAIYTYNLPREEVKGTLCEQLKHEESSLRDISGGFIYTNFRLLGTCMGYATRKIAKP